MSNLWASLNRVGEQFDDQCILQPTGETYLVLLKLREALTDGSKAAIREYIKSYVTASGWHCGGVVFATRYIRFRLSKEASKAR